LSVTAAATNPSIASGGLTNLFLLLAGVPFFLERLSSGGLLLRLILFDLLKSGYSFYS